MSQLQLFDSSETLLVDEERGRIAYTPSFVDAASAQAWFAEVRSGVKWWSERRMMYDREVDVPRLVGHFRLDPAPGFTPAAILDAVMLLPDEPEVLSWVPEARATFERLRTEPSLRRLEAALERRPEAGTLHP